MKSSSKVILGLVAAAAAGAAIGILATSEDGKKFRKKVKNSASDAAENVSDWLQARSEDVKEMKEKALKKGKKWKDELQESAEM